MPSYKITSSRSVLLPTLACLLLAALALADCPALAHPHRTLLAVRTTAPPDLAAPGDPAWDKARPVSVRDVVADIDVELRALHDGEHVYILTVFPDADENRQHRTLLWDKARKAYVDGPEREDAMVLKWSMVTHETGLTLHENAPYVADEWYWKACRSDHAGFADDKVQIYSAYPDPYAKAVLSANGKVFYLTRRGDEGDEAAQALLYPGYAGDRAPKFRFITPTGSRADVRAKGVWKDGRWSVAFERKLDTGHADDVRLSLDGAHPFGVSRYEIAGRDPEPNTDQPLFGCGDVGEILELRFEP